MLNCFAGVRVIFDSEPGNEVDGGGSRFGEGVGRGGRDREDGSFYSEFSEVGNSATVVCEQSGEESGQQSCESEVLGCVEAGDEGGDV